MNLLCEIVLLFFCKAHVNPTPELTQKRPFVFIRRMCYRIRILSIVVRRISLQICHTFCEVSHLGAKLKIFREAHTFRKRKFIFINYVSSNQEKPIRNRYRILHIIRHQKLREVYRMHSRTVIEPAGKIVCIKLTAVSAFFQYCQLQFL